MHSPDGEKRVYSYSMPGVLLFVDLLGVRARWLRGGRPAAETAFKDFRNLIAASLRGQTSAEVSVGLIETDAAAITCKDARTALEIGKRMYRMAFNQTRTNLNRHYWLRGVIVPRFSDSPLRKAGNFAPPLGHVELTHYEPELFDAIAIEKSGIKGMRLLIDKSLITPQIVKEYRIAIGSLSFIPFKTLRSSYYPPHLKDTHLDFLWMQSGDVDERKQFERTMASRLRIAAPDQEEFLQAAATQVMFFESAAMFGSIETRLEYQRKKAAAKKS
jgi:hypothetical protein